MKKNITLIVALMFTVAMSAQRTSTTQLSTTKVFTGVATGIKIETSGTYLLLQLNATPNSTVAPGVQKLKFAYETDGTTLKINPESKDIILTSGDSKKLNERFIRRKITVSAKLIGLQLEINTVKIN